LLYLCLASPKDSQVLKLTTKWFKSSSIKNTHSTQA